MKTKGIFQEKIYAKLLALSIIYEKAESCRRVFLERITYTDREMKIIMDNVPDNDFRKWLASAIPVMQCREI
jgi:hypothetical protein